MQYDNAVDMLAFNLKMLGKVSNKNVLISAGPQPAKDRLLPYIKKLSKMNISVYATEGTSLFLHKEGVDNQKIYKIAEKREPNIKSFLRDDRFDLVVNILSGNNDYDESSDSNLIRSLSIESGIPLITDLDVAIMTIQKMSEQQRENDYRTRIGKPKDKWNLKYEFIQLVESFGGFASNHAHFDKAYLINLENLQLGQVDMQRKWKLYRYLKENYTYEDLIERISRGVQVMIDQGATYCKTMVDVDSIVKLLPMKAALEVRNHFKDQIQLLIGTQPLEGVLDNNTRRYFTQACEMADFIGGLPSRDRPTPEKHLDYIMDIAKNLGKTIDVHVDQENNPDEDETELLALKTIEHGLEGRVNAVHAISIAAKPDNEKERIIQLMKEAGLGVIVCPSAALSMKTLDRAAPIHNSIAPIALMVNAQIPLYLGADNICDLFMPMCDGNMWFECRTLMESCRIYDIELIARMACRRSI